MVTPKRSRSDKVATTVEPPEVSQIVTAESPADECAAVVQDAIGLLDNVSLLIESNDWDQALEDLETILGNLVGLRDAMLEAQQKGI